VECVLVVMMVDGVASRLRRNVRRRLVGDGQPTREGVVGDVEALRVLEDDGSGRLRGGLPREWFRGRSSKGRGGCGGR
jgi:hypothetical protein